MPETGFKLATSLFATGALVNRQVRDTIAFKAGYWECIELFLLSGYYILPQDSEKLNQCKSFTKIRIFEKSNKPRFATSAFLH